MKFCLLVFSLAIFSFCFLFGKDTVETKISGEVVVQSEKVLARNSVSHSFFSFRIDRLYVPLLSSTSEVLSIFPGIYIRDYGGVGGIKTVSLRGYSSTDVTLLLDGSKINSQQNGLFDLTLLPLDIFENIDLYKSGSSVLWGNNSASGFLNFRFLKPKNEQSLKISYGSFGNLNFNANFSYQVNPLSSGIVGLRVFKSEGDYPIKINEFGSKKIIKRENSKIISYSIFLNNQIETNLFWSRINILFSHSKRGIPGAVLQNNIENEKAKLTDYFAFGSFKLIPHYLDSSIEISSKVMMTKSLFYDEKTNNLLLGKTTAEYLNKDLDFSIDYKRTFWGVNFNFLLETNFASIKGDMIENKENNDIERWTISTGLKILKIISFSKYRHFFETAFRNDVSSTFSPKYTFYIGVAIEDTSLGLNTKLNFSTNYRLPNFNEMFFLNYGNRDLRPEKTQSLNLEFIYYGFGYFKPIITFFFYNTEDKIISIPKTPIQWTALNIAKTQSTGFEIAMQSKTSFFESIVSYSYTRAIDKTKESPTFGKQLIYTPRNLVNVVFYFPIYKQFVIATKLFYSSERYALPDNSSSSKLLSYVLLDFSISKEIHLKKNKIFLNFEIFNILNSEYQIIFNYPMQSRHFLLTLKTII